MLKVNDPVQIQKVANGWIVQPASRGDGVAFMTDIHVFQTYKSMADWLFTHFTASKKA